MSSVAAEKLVFFGVPGSGISELSAALQRMSTAKRIWDSDFGVSQISGYTEHDLAIVAPEKLAEIEDQSVARLDPAAFDIFCFTGSELARPVNQKIVRNWATQSEELICDLKTQVQRLGFNVAHQVGLGPVRAQLRTQTRERRELWEAMGAATLDTSGWSNAQFELLAAKILQGN